MNKTRAFGGGAVITFTVLVLYLFTQYYSSYSSAETYQASSSTPLLQVVELIKESVLPKEKDPPVKLFTYIEVVDGCNTAFVGGCVNMRSGPGTQYPIAVHLRTGVVLKVGEMVHSDGRDWYKILFSTELLYPDRLSKDLYVAAENVRLFSDDGDHMSIKGQATTTKRIIVDVSEQKLYAYDGEVLFMQESISTGLEFTPTPRGTFSVFKMTPSRFMQGPIPGVSDQVYDLPGVPWNLYFTSDGAVIHGAYWHDKFGQPWSHGCVNLSPLNAKKLYDWAIVGTKVIVQN